MNIITIQQSGQNISVSEDTSNGIVTLSESLNNDIEILTINQGQQGPAGVSIIVNNYGDNRLTTSDGTQGGLYAESDLTFDGSKLRVSGVEVSLSGHNHNLSDIIGISGAISSGVTNTLSNLSTISNECDIEYVIIQNSVNNTQLVKITDFANAISTIDGGGVSYSGC
jgi:hypothetical protein